MRPEHADDRDQRGRIDLNTESDQPWERSTVQVPSPRARIRDRPGSGAAGGKSTTNSDRRRIAIGKRSVTGPGAPWIRRLR
ncbi:hypothetical protein FHR81_000186 [Actinoalloteichus hoggarensis]|uniref:Uncharacterized protein n=1 Tax=Actinoalloteichus hoggarensis TaxID=1470176 RepID=A0A221W2S2_9PSEU|nr:hypothetical protein AHOG_12435 [Actinoalloteichus hoggarensis]MBB5919157.1 hypothetical protein [Actinoalloteichus hoggarensis]